MNGVKGSMEPHSGGGRWYALYTRPRFEKKVANCLQRKGITTYLPLWRRVHRWSDREKEIALPLFPCYLFVHMDLQHYQLYLETLRTRGVVKFVRFNGHGPEPVDDEEVENVRRVCESGLPYDPFPYLTEGRWVEVRRGPLKGVRGYIVRRDNNTRLVITVTLIMQAVSVIVPIEAVEPLW